MNGNKPALLQNSKVKNKKKTKPIFTCFNCNTLSFIILTTKFQMDNNIQKKKAYVLHASTENIVLLLRRTVDTQINRKTNKTQNNNVKPTLIK